MSKKEKDIIKVIVAALPNMSDFDKGYFLGVAESKASDSELHIEETHKEEAVSV